MVRVVLRKLSYITRWKFIECLFGMRLSAMCAVFYEVVDKLVQKNGHLLEKFQEDLIIQRPEVYMKDFYNKGAPLDNCVGFIDFTNIQMCRPGGRNAVQRSCH